MVHHYIKWTLAHKHSLSFFLTPSVWLVSIIVPFVTYDLLTAIRIQEIFLQDFSQISEAFASEFHDNLNEMFSGSHMHGYIFVVASDI